MSTAPATRRPADGRPSVTAAFDDVAPEPRAPRRSGAAIGAAALAAVLAIALVAVVVGIVTNPPPDTDGSDAQWASGTAATSGTTGTTGGSGAAAATAPAAPAAEPAPADGEGATAPGTDAPPSGEVAVLRPASVRASSTAPVGRDGQGNAIGFDAANLVDGDPTTAWRTRGAGVGEVVTLEFPAPVTVVSVALVPGYAKVDPVSDIDRFPQNRRVQQVRWRFDTGQVEQSFADRPQMQSAPVEPAVTTRTVTVEILASTAPGERDFTAISEIEVRGAPA